MIYVGSCKLVIWRWVGCEFADAYYVGTQPRMLRLHCSKLPRSASRLQPNLQIHLNTNAIALYVNESAKIST
jgi:hypothetical protein